MIKYWNNLKQHPGTQVVMALQIMGVLSGLMSEQHSLTKSLVGFGAMSICWIPVLITNHTNNVVK